DYYCQVFDSSTVLF
nr:immunoglobulin light chain junction region [Macaca mulatta]